MPLAPWVDDAASVYPQLAASVAEDLKARLLARAARLDTEDIDSLLLEIRCQMAEEAVTGSLIGAGDLAERALSLVYAKEHSHRL